MTMINRSRKAWMTRKKRARPISTPSELRP